MCGIHCGAWGPGQVGLVVPVYLLCECPTVGSVPRQMSCSFLHDTCGDGAACGSCRREVRLVFCGQMPWADHATALTVPSLPEAEPELMAQTQAQAGMCTVCIPLSAGQECHRGTMELGRFQWNPGPAHGSPACVSAPWMRAPLRSVLLCPQSARVLARHGLALVRLPLCGPAPRHIGMRSSLTRKSSQLWCL